MSTPEPSTYPPTRNTAHSAPLPPADPGGDLPAQFGRYRIVRKLGQGGMGAVYLAHDGQLDRPVALKVPRFTAGDGESIERFNREARTAATLQHPNLCPVYDVGDVDGRHYLTMAYIEGRSLAELIKGGEPLPEKPVADLVRKLALALEEAHSKGVVHRDLKPANIMINDRHEPVILDFGLARQVHQTDVRLTAPGTLLGTPAYMPPEQVRGDTTAMGPRCDIYSLGVVLYELLTGQLPFQGANLGALISQVLTTNPPLPSTCRAGISKELEAICLKAMEKDPARRFPSMAQFAGALAAFLNNEAAPLHVGLEGSTTRMAVPATPSGTGLATQLIDQLMARLDASEARGNRRQWWPWIAAGFTALSLGILLWVALFRPPPAAPPTIVVYLRVQKLDPTVKYILLADRRIPREEVGEEDTVAITLPAGEYTVKFEKANGEMIPAGTINLTSDHDKRTVEVKGTTVALLEPPDSRAGSDKEPALQPLPPPVETKLPTGALILIDAPDQYPGKEWAARNLVAPPGEGDYASNSANLLSIVVGFPPGKLAQITALGINPTTTSDKRNWVSQVEFEVSDTYPFTGFRKVGFLEVPQVPNDALLRLKSPITARYVRFNFLKNRGGGYFALNRVLVMGNLVADGGKPPPVLVNVALKSNGGKVRQFSSQYDNSSWQAANLIDGNPGLSWCSKTEDVQPTIMLELGRPALVRHIVVNPYTLSGSGNVISEAEITVSETEKGGDFRSVGTLPLGPIGGDYSLDLPTPEKARFIRLHFRRHDNGYVQAHEIKVFAEPAK